MGNIKLNRVALYGNLFLFFITGIVLIFVCTGCDKNKEQTEKVDNKNVNIIISDQNDGYINLLSLDYHKKTNSVFGLYKGMQTNMLDYYYRLFLSPPISFAIYGKRGQGPEEFKNPPICLRVFDPFVMVISFYTIKIFDLNGNFIKNINNIPLYPEDFYFENGRLTLLRLMSDIRQLSEQSKCFVEYDISEKTITKAITFKKIYEGFRKNGIDLKKTKNHFIGGKVLNSNVAVLCASHKKFHRNGFLVLNLNRNKVTFCKAPHRFKYYAFSFCPGIFRSACNKHCFFVVEYQLNIPFYKKLPRSKLNKMFYKRKKPPMICIHRINENGKEIGSYIFNWYKKGMVNIYISELIEITPDKFVVFVSVSNRDKTNNELVLLWSVK